MCGSVNEMLGMQSTVVVPKKAIPLLHGLWTPLARNLSGLYQKGNCIQLNLRQLIGSVVRHGEIHACIRTEYEVNMPSGCWASHIYLDLSLIVSVYLVDTLVV